MQVGEIVGESLSGHLGVVAWLRANLQIRLFLFVISELFH
jgi:hypothetical protein